MGCSSSAPVAVPVRAHKHKAFRHTFVLGDRLGRGSFGQVHRAHNKEGTWAVKVLDVRDPVALCEEDFYDDKKSLRAENELKLWQQIGLHENVIRLAGATLELGLCFMAMECCDASMEAFLRGQDSVNERVIGDVLRQTLTACEHVHAKRVIHRDIKAENLLVRGNTMKLIDFGLAFGLDEGKMVQGVSGTPAFMAPEMVNKQPYDFCVDIWAVGVMVYTMLFGEYPYNGEQRTKDAMKAAIGSGDDLPTFQPSSGGLEGMNGKIMEKQQLPAISPAAVTFARALLARKAHKRPIASAALELDFLARPSAAEALPDLRPTFESAVKCGSFGRFASRQQEVTELDDYLHFIKKNPRVGLINRGFVTMVPWNLTQPAVIEKAAENTDCQIPVKKADAPMKAKEDECATPSTVASPWAESASEMGAC